jgi:S-adenosylmethionine-dependent carboxyl methyltransferase
MSAITMRNHGVMEGKGAYNKHARVQAGGIALALPFLEKAARDVQIIGGSQPVVIADYGSSQGKNSLAPMRVAIENLRPRVGPNRPIFVFHVDQAANDFNSLFEVLGSDPDSYGLAEPHVFPCAIGRSFYEQVVPPDSVNLGWCSYAAVWLSRIPARVPGHFFPFRDTNPARAAFQRQAADDWKTFLSLRASELRSGGRLIVVLPAFNDDGVTGFEDLMDNANSVLAEMVDAGELRTDERSRMVLGACPRRRCDLLAPFQADGHFEHLTVECCELISLPDVSWADYKRDGDMETLATKQARFFRATFAPSLACALTDSQNGTANGFADRLENQLKQRLASQPAPLHSFVQIFVAGKRI